MSYPSLFESVDIRQMLADYPIGAAFTQRYTSASRAALDDWQNHQFLKLVTRGWQIGFYRRLWRAAGLEPGDIRSIEDIGKLPVYDKADLMASLEAYPPLGDFAGLEAWAPHERPPVFLHTTSGTTGKPQVLLFGAKGREIANLLLARMIRWQGLTSEDIVHSVYGHGMINGGHYVREVFTHFTNALFLSAGTGIETRSAVQVKLMADFGATVLVGFVDYIRKLADVAREEGFEPGRDIPVRMITGHLGMDDRSAVEKAWGGAKAFDWYGVGDTGTIAGEGPERDGLYVWEDAQYLELLDVDSGKPIEPLGKGNMVVTTLYKDDVFPCIRFNTHDVSAWKGGASQTGVIFKRIHGFLGRSDNMVKLRGINVFPHAIGSIIERHPGITGEYVCILSTNARGREDMQVLIEHRSATAEDQAALATLLRQTLGVEVLVELVGPGATAALTDISVRQKPIRLIDRRAAAGSNR